jgi:iron complex transport system substrate-binding protein
VGALAVGRIAPTAAAAAAALLLAATACGERSEPTGAAVSVYPVRVTDARDRPVRVDARPARIAALMPAGRQILTALGAGKRLATARGGFFDAKGKLVLTRLRAAKPDLVIAAQDSDDERDLASLGVPVYFTPQNSIRDVEHAITQLGLLAGAPVAARLLVHRIEETRSTVLARVAKTPRVSVFVDTGFFTTVPDTTLAGDLIREARGTDVAGPTPPPGPFSLAKLSQLDPDVYLATSNSGTTLEQLRRDAHTKHLRAVRNGRFAVVASNLFLPGPQVGQALAEIARILHPDAFR